MSDGFECYELKHLVVPPLGQGQIASAAFIDCDLCGRPLSSCGGPGRGYICMSCAEIVMSGQARGAIKYGE